jgi:hypothetical protein
MRKKFGFLDKKLVEDGTQGIRGGILVLVVILEEEVASSPRPGCLQFFVRKEFG